MEPGESVFMLFLVAVFVLLNAFFVLSEFCLVKVRTTMLEEQANDGHKGASNALKMVQNLDTYLSACQLGVTLSSLALGWIGEPVLAKILTPLFEYFHLKGVLISSLSFALAFSFITLLHVVLGELVPKSIAIQKANACVLIIARPLHLFWMIFLPFIKIFDCLASLFLKLLGFENAHSGEVTHSEEEIKLIASQSQKGGVLDEFETELIHNALDFADTVAKEVMTPRKDMVCLDAKRPYEANLSQVMSSTHSRFPLIDGSKDQVLGIIHIRDLMQNELGGEKKSLDELRRDIIIVPEHSSISKVLLAMTKAQSLTALVVDEYGGTAGLLTMEDITEELFGEINDEYDEKNQGFKKLSQDAYEFEGRFDIEEAFELLGVDYDEDELLEVSVGGYVFNLFGKVPKLGEIIEDDACIYEVKELGDKSVLRVKMVKKEEEAKSL